MTPTLSKPVDSAFRAHSTSWLPVAPGTLFGRKIPVRMPKSLVPAAPPTHPAKRGTSIARPPTEEGCTYSGSALTLRDMERHVAAVEDACERAGDANELFATVSDRLRRVVPFDGACWFGMDPKTVLPTAPARVENIGDGHCDTYWQREATVEDSLLFRDLARAASPAASLYQATDDRPARSARYREFLAPQSYGDEGRAALKTGGSTWGVVDIFREQGRASFTTAEVSFLAAIGPVIASALRSFATATMAAPPASLDAPGPALFDGPACGLLSLDEQAERWFTELAGESWHTIPLSMTAVYAVVARAQAVAEGRERGPAAVRLRAASGRWLSVHASALRNPRGGSGPIALTIEPA